MISVNSAEFYLEFNYYSNRNEKTKKLSTEFYLEFNYYSNRIEKIKKWSSGDWNPHPSDSCSTLPRK